MSFGYYLERLVDRLAILVAGLEGVRPCGEDQDTDCLLPTVYIWLVSAYKNKVKRISVLLAIKLMAMHTKSNVVAWDSSL